MRYIAYDINRGEIRNYRWWKTSLVYVDCLRCSMMTIAMAKNAEIIGKPLTQAIAAVVLTAIGYVSSYFFESGYLSMFGIEMMLVQVTTSVLIIGATTTLLIGAAMWVILWGVFNIPIKGKPVLAYLQTLAGVALAAAMCLMILSIISDTVFAILIVPIVSFFIFSFLAFLSLPLFYILSRRKGLRSSLKRLFDADDSEYKSRDSGKINIVSWIVFGCFVVATSFGLGRYSAVATNTFGTIHHEGSCYVIIRKYDDVLITKLVDRDAELTERSVTILRMKDEMRIKFINKNQLRDCQ